MQIQEIESAFTFTQSDGWQMLLLAAERDLLKPYRARLMDPQLSERDHTGYVRAIEAVRALLELPYRRVAQARGTRLEDELPDEVARLFP